MVEDRTSHSLRRLLSHKWWLGGWEPDFSRSYWTLCLADTTIFACVVQSLIGWKIVMSAIGFVPSAVWHPSSWFATRTGQSLPVALTWLTYPFPHMNWFHMGGNVVGILVYGSVVERMMGTLRFIAFTAVASVFGVFGLAAIHPLGADAIAGGSLLLCTMLGGWLASFSQAWAGQHKLRTLAIEIAAVASLLAWLAYRTPPSRPSPLLGLLWHAPSLMVGWFGFRVVSAFQSGAVRKSNVAKPSPRLRPRGRSQVSSDRAAEL